ncbi:hypothetical protein R9X47_14755 [Wukongibacter baidiensis]|uniref:hypothetical protein n=1 Tax=Wukongibacter baidiensis TaxID=1723361 RepID=UPI003D7FAF60
MYILIILGYLIIGIIEIVPLYKNNKKKELVVYSIFFSAAFIISLLLSLGVKIPSPAKPIETIVNTILGK